MVQENAFKLLVDFETTYSPSKVYNWRSERTGLQVVLITKETPMVSGYFAVGSEIDNDSGCPHTLEHLIFMGSQKYPYKGLLDTIGNKMYSVTNAWTDTDQTVYTLETAGWEGFRELLPVYLDHLFHPTLTDSSCLTEVYHIDGKAEEKGVVFAEMQGTENDCESLVMLQSRKLLFGDKSPFATETGGIMSALRVLTNDQIRQFHDLRYRPDNVCIIVTGAVDPDGLIGVMNEFDNLLRVNPSPRRPFVDVPATGHKLRSVQEFVDFPDSQERSGEVQLSWIGPNSNDDVVLNMALDILGSYLSREGDGKLQISMVDRKRPSATDIYYYSNDYTNTVINFYFNGVGVDKLEEIKSEALEVISNESQNIDLELIRDCVERKRNSFLNRVERDASSLFNSAIGIFLYGSRDGQDYKKWMETVEEFDILSKWTAEQWQKVIETYLVDNPVVAIMGKPSRKLYNQLMAQKKTRLEEYRKRYGKNGLEMLQKKVEQAQMENNKSIPKSILNQFITPDPRKIRFIKSTTAKAGLAGGEEDNDIQRLVSGNSPENFPLYLHFEHYPSQFVKIRIVMSTVVIAQELLPYLDVIFRDLFTLPMKLPDDTTLLYTDVVRLVKKDTIENYIGPGGAFEEHFEIHVKAKVENYSIAIEWIRRVMWDSIFDPERLEVLVEKHLDSIYEEKRDPSVILNTAIVRMLYTERSLKRNKDINHSMMFYDSLLDDLSYKKEVVKIQGHLEEIRKKLFNTSNMRILVSGDITKIDNPVTAWQPLLTASSSSLTPISRSFEFLSDQGKQLCKYAVIIPMPATESSYLTVFAQGPTNYLDNDIPALALCSEYLQAVEGPLWRGVRGNGLAYGAGVDRDLESSVVMYHLTRATDASKALLAAKQIVENLAGGVEEFDDEMIEGAICSIVNSIASHELNGEAVADAKFDNIVLMNRGANYTMEFLDKLRKVSKLDMVRAMKRYFVPLFDKNSSLIFVACNPSMVGTLQRQFSEMGYQDEIIDDELDEDDEETEEETDSEMGNQDEVIDGELDEDDEETDEDGNEEGNEDDDHDDDEEL